MKHCQFILSFYFFFSFFSLKAQDVELNKILSGKNDTTKVNNLLSYAKKFKKLDELRAESVFNEALKVSQQLKYEKGIGLASVNLGYTSYNLGKYRESIPYFKMAVNVFQRLKMTRELCGSLIDLGGVYETIGEKDSTIYYDMMALKILETQPFLRERSRAYINIGTFYNNLKSFDKAIYYQKKALDLAKSIKDTSMLSYAYTGLSLSYDNINNKKAAFKMAGAALALAKLGQNKTALSYAYDQYANASVGVGKYNEAITAAQQAIKLSRAINMVDSYLSASLSLAKAYSQKGDYKKGIQVLEVGLNKCKEVGNLDFADDFYEMLAQAHYAIGNHKKAADFYKQVTVYRDSVFSSENNRMVAEQEVKHKTAQKEKELSEKKLDIIQKDLKVQKGRQQVIYSISIAVIALLIACMIFFDYRNKKKLHARQLKELQQEKEIQLLQALMQGEEQERSRIAKDLHDGVAGMLAAVKMHFNSIAFQNRGVLQTEGFQQGIQLLDEAATEIRKTSHNLMPELLTQRGLDEALRRYCNNISNSKALDVQYDSWGEIRRYKQSFELSIYRIVQELLNNILKHSKANQVIVQMSMQNHILSLTIEDNGIGFNHNLSSDGLGLQSLQSRVKAMNGKMEVEAETGKGVSAYLEFDVTELMEKASLEMA